MSLGHCDTPEDISNGTITYTNGDPSNVFIGDVLIYSCEVGYELLGASERFCMRNGNWSGPQPQCSAIGEEAYGRACIHDIVGV